MVMAKELTHFSLLALAFSCLTSAYEPKPLQDFCVADPSSSGDADFLKPHGTELLKSVEDYVVIRHPKGHTIPRLDEEGLETMLKFIDRIQKIISNKEDVVTV